MRSPHTLTSPSCPTQRTPRCVPYKTQRAKADDIPPRSDQPRPSPCPGPGHASPAQPSAHNCLGRGRRTALRANSNRRKERQGKARPGKARQGKARQDKAHICRSEERLLVREDVHAPHGATVHHPPLQPTAQPDRLSRPLWAPRSLPVVRSACRPPPTANRPDGPRSVSGGCAALRQMRCLCRRTSPTRKRASGCRSACSAWVHGRPTWMHFAELTAQQRREPSAWPPKKTNLCNGSTPNPPGRPHAQTCARTHAPGGGRGTHLPFPASA